MRLSVIISKASIWENKTKNKTETRHTLFFFTAYMNNCCLIECKYMKNLFDVA